MREVLEYVGVVDRYSVDSMVRGYETLIEEIYDSKCQRSGKAAQTPYDDKRANEKERSRVTP